MSEYLVSQAQKALFTLSAKTKSALGYLPPSLALKMFDTYILPILEFNSMIWSTNRNHSNIEKVQLGYLKNILGVRRQTPSLAVYAETGRLPLLIRQQINTINYWARLRKLPENDILSQCLKIQVDLNENHENSWFQKAINVIESCNIENWEEIDPIVLAEKVKAQLRDTEIRRIINDFNNSDLQPKLRTYKLFKTNLCIEPHLTIGLPKKMYKNISRFRTSSHNLRIETGRHESPKLPVEERLCTKCDLNEVEDELHFLLICSSNQSLRIKLTDTATRIIPNFRELNNLQKFIAILTSAHTEVLTELGNFLNETL